jgi:hypothetical protein
MAQGSTSRTGIATGGVVGANVTVVIPELLNFGTLARPALV